MQVMLLVKNKKALRNYELIEKFVSGIKLYGYEVKAIREGNANFEGSYIKFIDNRPYVVSMTIGRYSKQSISIDKTNPTRDRALLMHKKEIAKLKTAISQKGKSAVPLALILNHNLVKLELALVKGRKEFEKKHLEKERQIKKDLDKFNSLTTREFGK